MSSSSATGSGSRPSTTLAAFLIGLPLAAGVLYGIHHAPVKGEAIQTVRRYVTHPVQWAVVGLFCCALGTLLAKLWQCLIERRACRALSLPAWDGKPAAATEASRLAGYVDRLSYRLRRTFIARRVLAVLDFLRQRKTATGLDDQLRSLADTDGFALETSYALTRFITWAIPILGFLGTVLGITGAISGVTPEVLEKSLSTVTDGLALAFDTTALGLALTMITMFCSFVVERAEQNVLETVDRIAERELAHRFERAGGDGGDYLALARQQTQVLLKAVEQLVQRQADVWAKTFDKTAQQHVRTAEQQQTQLTQGLKAALETTLDAHHPRLSPLHKQPLNHGPCLL